MAEIGEITRKITQDNFVTERIDVIKNNLLGSYDDDGDYVIAPQIVKELLEMEKIKKTTFANSVFCIGNLLGYGEIVFELIFNSKTKDGVNAVASLYVLEDIDKINGYLQNTIKTHLADFHEDVENFMEETYAYFKIVNSPDEDDADVLERKLIDDLENDSSYILAKKQFSLLLDKLLEEKFLDAYGKYFTSRISALTKIDNEFTRTVLNSFNTQYSLIQNVFLQEKNYKMLNELLDKCIEEHSGLTPTFSEQEKEFNHVVKPALDTFVNNVNELSDKFEQKALNMLDKSDREKVEVILEEVEENQIEHQQPQVQPSVQQMVNDMPKNTFTPSVEPQTEIVEEQTKSVELEDNSNDSFYDMFKETYAKTKQTPDAEHVTEYSSDSESLTATTLKDRISRLESIKNNSQTNDSSQQPQQSDSFDMSSYYEQLARQKKLKETQIVRNHQEKRNDFDREM